MYLLGYDLGSSSIKAGLVEVATGGQIAVVSYPDQEMEIMSEQSGWAEQNPETWWQNLIQATKRLLAQTQVQSSEIKAIGISYQMHGLVLVDDVQKVLRPAIIWCDSRAVAIGDEAFETIGQAQCLKSVLNSPGNFTASKLKWVKDHEPEIFNSTYKAMLPGDYIAMKLTGDIRTTVSGLSEGVLWDFAKGEMSQDVLDYYGFDSSLFPEVVDCTAHQGAVTAEAAAQLGLVSGVPITYRAGDQPNNALSLNVLEPGEIAATCGTSGVVYGVVDKATYDLKSQVNGFAHVNHVQGNDRIGVLLCINGAGIQYSWLKRQLASENQQYNDLEQLASSVSIGSDGIAMLPFGNGAERIFQNKNIGSHILGLDFNRHHQSHLYRAALEGVAFSFVYGLTIFKEMGIAVDVLRVGNDNMFQSEVFAKTIATLLDCEIEVVDTTGAYGAARASGVAVGTYKDLSEALGNITPSFVYKPDFNKALCNDAYQRWLKYLAQFLT